MKKFLHSSYLYYTLCFIMLNAIDFVRNTQNGDIWSVAANCTGLVVMLLVFKTYTLKDFRNLFTYIWTGVCAVANVGVLLSGQDHIGTIYYWAFIIALLNVWWIGIAFRHLILLFFIEKKEKLHFSIVSILWLTMTLFMTFSKSEKIWPAWFLCIFGIFYLTRFESGDITDMLNGMIDGTIISFFLLQIYAYGFRPFDELRYVGAFPNSNITSLHYLIVYGMILFKLHLLHVKKAHKIIKFIFFLGASGLLCFILLTMGRTALMDAALVTLFYGIFVIYQRWQYSLMKTFQRGIALCLCVVLLFPIVFGTARWLPTVLHHPVWYEGEYSINKVHSFDPATSDKYTDMDEFLESIFHRFSGTFSAKVDQMLTLHAIAAEAEDADSIEYITVDKIGTENMDESLRIRLSIYKAYLQNLTWTGHPQSDGHYFIAETNYFSWHAQNVWLQIAYSYGIPSGILFILLTASIFKITFKKMQNKKDNPYSIIPFLISLLFFTYGTLELVWNIGQLVLFLLFFIQHPQIEESKIKEVILN